MLFENMQNTNNLLKIMLKHTSEVVACNECKEEDLTSESISSSSQLLIKYFCASGKKDNLNILKLMQYIYK